MFRLITTNVHEQIMNGSTQEFRLFITGNAGTGNNFTLQLLKNQMNLWYGKLVTTVSLFPARLIGGSTLQVTLKLRVQKHGSMVKTPLLTGIWVKESKIYNQNS